MLAEPKRQLQEPGLIGLLVYGTLVRDVVMRLCESEGLYRALENAGRLKRSIDAYSIGQRTTSVLDTLARARAWSHNIGELVPIPTGYDRTTWNDILDTLVLRILGNRRCLNCGGFYRSSNTSRCKRLDSPYSVSVDKCIHCGKTETEPIGCIKGIKGVV